jgi:hypothetical protein
MGATDFENVLSPKTQMFILKKLKSVFFFLNHFSGQSMMFQVKKTYIYIVEQYLLSSEKMASGPPTSNSSNNFFHL